jgi:hypothetical protein
MVGVPVVLRDTSCRAADYGGVSCAVCRLYCVIPGVLLCGPDNGSHASLFDGLHPIYSSEFTMEDGKDYIANDYLVISENPPSEQTPFTYTRTTRVSGRKMYLGDPEVPKIVLMVGTIMKYGEDEDDEMEIVSWRAVAVVMDPADGSGRTFTHVLEYELENDDEGAGHVDPLPYYSPVDSDGFLRDYDKFTGMILLGAPPVKRGLVHLGRQLHDTDRKEVWLEPSIEYGVKYTVTGLFDSKAQCFDMGKGFRLFVPGFMEKRERTVPTFC